MRTVLCGVSETCLVIILLVITVLIKNSVTISESLQQNYNVSKSCRYKRHVVFPQKANLVLTLALLKSTIVHKTLCTVHETDFPFPLPQTYRFVFRDRRTIHQHFENGLTLFGFKGRQCVQRAICEMKQIDEEGKFKHEDLAHEILSVVFRNTGFTTDCSPYQMEQCPFSIIDLIYYFFHTVLKDIEEGLTESSPHSG